MSDIPRRAVAFDFDGTLTTTDTTKYLMAALLRRRPQRLASLLPVLLRRAFGWIAEVCAGQGVHPGASRLDNKTTTGPSALHHP